MDDDHVQVLSCSNAVVVFAFVWSYGDLGIVALNDEEEDDKSDNDDDENNSDDDYDDNSDDDDLDNSDDNDDDDKSEYLGKKPNFHEGGNKRF